MSFSFDSKFSAPHGALGTDGRTSEVQIGIPVTIPHGGLGTEMVRITYKLVKGLVSPSHTVGLELLKEKTKRLSTPHGTLGTRGFERTKKQG